MATGAVAAGLSLDGRGALSEALMWIALALWLFLAALLAARFAFHRQRFVREARLPPSLTGVAGTCVLGALLTDYGWTWAGTALLAIAAAFWAALLGPVLRHWTTPTVGGSFLLAVSTQALSVLASTLALAERAEWLLEPALALLALGLALYLLVLRGFDPREVASGGGDQWVAGGALAFSALGVATLDDAARELGALGEAHAGLATADLVLWGLALAWLPLLVMGEAVRPHIGFDVRRWATVFPLAIYAASSLGVGRLEDQAWIVTFGRVWVWVGLGAWAAAFLASAARAVACGPAAGRLAVSGHGGVGGDGRR